MEQTTLKELLEPIKIGESEIKQLLRAAAYKVEDVSDNPQYWYKDIDLLVTNPRTGNTAAIEVKRDTRISETGNFFIEYENPRSRGGKGWFEFCEADFLYYIDAAAALCYVIKLDKLRRFIQENKTKLTKKQTTDDSKGYIVPLAAMPLYTTISL